MRLTVKLGGSILEHEDVRRGILRQVHTLRTQGHEIVLVHGGGKSLSRRLAQLGLKAEFVRGLRVTDGETLAVALMVLAGEVNKTIVAELGGAGSAAVGLCGADAALVRCVPLAQVPGEPQNLGFVGRAVSLNRDFLELLLRAEMIPVIASIALGPNHDPHNVNADQMASVFAWGGGCEALVYLTDVHGIQDEEGRVVERMDAELIETLRTAGVISGGMLPKTDACLEALSKGVRSVHIVKGSSPDVLSRLLEGRLGEGTRIYAAG